MYKIVLEETAGEGILTDYSDGLYLIREGYTIKSFTDTTGAPGTMIGKCHVPGVTGVTFAAFNPCAGAPYGSTYTLADGRDQKTYKVKYLADGRYWMVQNLAFGEKCETKTSMGGKTTAGNITDNGTYYGDCFKANFSGAGYLYNYTAGMNVGVTPSGYYCSGTTSGTASGTPSTCRGVCPDGWHIPTAPEWSAMDSNVASLPGCASKLNCLWTDTGFGLVRYDHIDNNSCDFCESSGHPEVYWHYDTDVMRIYSDWSFYFYVRCVMNY
jgi:uncharacterized protein (TIGR02145 family)